MTSRSWAWALLAWLSIGCGGAAPSTDHPIDHPAVPIMDTVRSFYRVYNEHDIGLWSQTIAPTYTAHVNGQTIKSRDEGVEFVTTLLKAFPDIHFTIDDSLEAGNRASVRWSATGTHRGELFGVAPTQKKVTMIGISIFRVENGQITELWDVWDQAALMQQLEAK